jgi:peptide/nickel transport system substrate-binding protein
MNRLSPHPVKKLKKIKMSNRHPRVFSPPGVSQQTTDYKRSNLFSVKLKTLLLIAVFLFFSRSLAIKAEEPGAKGDAFVAGSSADAIILVPFLADDAPSSGICSLIFSGLTKIDKDLEVIGDLARDWEVSEDKLTITFYLKEGVQWQDGRELTADDIKFTYQAILDPKNASPYIASYQDIEEIKIIDKHTVQFKYQRPYAPALSKLGMGIIPKHILEDENIRESPFKRQPTGSGPYKLATWKTDQYTILDSFGDYFEGAPYIDRYVMRIIPDETIQFLELITTQIDYMNLSPYQYRYRTETEKFRQRFKRYKYLARSYSYIGYNLDDPLFKDKRVRQALSYAIDKKAIIEGVLMGLGEECTGPFLKDSLYYNEEARRYPYNPDKAKRLLEEAGWVYSEKDEVLKKDGEEFSFRLVTNQGNKQRQDIATIVQRNWSRIGIKVDVQTIAWQAFINEFIDKRNFQAVILGWTIPIDPDIYNVWHSSSAREGGLNFIGYKNSLVDRLIEEGRATFDQEERAQVYQKIHALLAEEQPYTFLYFPYSLPAVHRRFRGIEPASAGLMYNFIDWYVLEIEQKYTW